MRFRKFSVLVALGAVLVSAGTASAGNTFAGSTSTIDGRRTWNSDMINAESVTQTGAGVYVAVLDTGLVPNWNDYIPAARVATQYGAGFDQQVTFKPGSTGCEFDVEAGPVKQSTNFNGSRSSSHGTHVASIITGFNYDANPDEAAGFDIGPVQVRGIAPLATIIPVRVLDDYQLPSFPHCPEATQSQTINFGTDSMVAAGIDYVTSLKRGPLAGKPVVINMSLGGDTLADVEKTAIDNAVAAGVVVVAAAGNEGDDGMHFPGAYAPVISAGAAGWTKEWLDNPLTSDPPSNGSRYRMFWLQGDGLRPNSGNVADPTSPNDVYVTDFSSRSLNRDQDLDVLAPGSWVRGPFPGTPGYNHLPWWSKGKGDLNGNNSGNFFYVGGTSQATPHVSAAAALLLQKRPSLTGPQIEALLAANSLSIGAGTRQVWDPFNTAGPGFYPISWGRNAVGNGLLQLDKVLAAA